ncbi:MAG: hypothetical protein NTX33_04425, partial [Propionibacteriales bacterium]|nr:hypothetical protein [Propionibacteriales bacterium]
AGDLGLLTVLEDDGGDDQSGFRHGCSVVAGSFLCLERSLSYVLSQNTTATASQNSRPGPQDPVCCISGRGVNPIGLSCVIITMPPTQEDPRVLALLGEPLC